MKHKHLSLQALNVIGEKASSTLALLPGLNVVTGSTDSGKSWALLAIDYLLGATEPPPTIPEAEPYDSVRLSLRVVETNNELVLERPLGGGKAVVLDGMGANANALASLSLTGRGKNRSTISSYLLNEIGASDHAILSRLNGTRRALSLRDLMHLSVVNEEDIIKRSSPVHKQKYPNKTEEISVLRLMLNPNESTTAGGQRRAGVSGARSPLGEQVQKFIANAKAELVTLPEIVESLTEMDDTITKSTADVAILRRNVAERQHKLMGVQTDLLNVQKQIQETQEKLAQFQLLLAAYDKDTKRLMAIRDVASALSNLESVICPTCAQPITTTAAAEVFGTSLSDYHIACGKELAQVILLKQELHPVLDHLAREFVTLQKLADSLELEIATQRQLLGQEEEQLLVLGQGLRELISNRIAASRRQELSSLIDQLSNAYEASHRPIKATVRTLEDLYTLAAKELNPICTLMGSMLRTWHAVKEGRVCWSSDTVDFVVDGKHRKAFGKGMRALIYSAFVVALAEHCIQNDCPHPGLVLLDSPIFSYRKRLIDPELKESDLISPETKDLFFSDLSIRVRRFQVVVFEHELPPAVGTIAHTDWDTAADGQSGFLRPPSG